MSNGQDNWKNRRRMAWASLVAGLVYPLLTLATESASLEGIAVHFYLFVTGVVAGYITMATFDHKWQNGDR